ncbi:hypothetical protein CBR_g38661 [Chara braunii]|uniref:DDE Tnp4 domain-containing protein n=1 Tax=Chara braunii TaxID=69332 RepID=A0A388K0Q1_CHABU|nr:hypothetical protein CBR_g38661 [Chara braunii]|eukprot:GBG63595.1 hypothetical protein CBR_g38661 [Chara braunii]
MDVVSHVAAREGLTETEKGLLVTVLTAVCRHVQTTGEARLRSLRRMRRQTEVAMTRAMADSGTPPVSWDAPFLMANAIVAGVLPRETPRWWVRRRTGGTWEDLSISDDVTTDYYHEKLRMSKEVFQDIVAACTPFLHRQVTHYRQPLQPDHIFAYALYRWASGETFDSGTCSFGIGRATDIKAVRDVTDAILAAYLDIIGMPVGRHQRQVIRAFGAKGFPNCFGAIDCTHVYVDKPANAPAEDYFDRKQQCSIVAQVVVDLEKRVLDVFCGYPGTVHDARVLWNSSLYRRAMTGTLFNAEPVILLGGVSTTGYLLGDNGYGPMK